MKKKIILRSEYELKNFFNDNTLRMKKKSYLSFQGNLELG